MSIRDLVESDCGGSNSLVKLSTHFLQDHAFKDQDLKQSTQTAENSDQRFLESSTGELADQFFSSVENDTFKMDDLLTDMRSIEGSSRENAWPTQFTKKFEKPDQLFDPNIWSSRDNKMLIKDEVDDFGYNSEWVKEIEQSYQNQEINDMKSRFDFEKIKENVIILDDTVSSDNFLESQNKMSIENSIGMPINNFGIELYGNPLLANQNFQQFRGFGQGWDINNLSNTMIPSTSRIDEPIMVAGGSSSLANRVVETNESESNTEIRNDQSNFQSLYSEFEEMKNAERKQEYTFTPDNEMDSIENPLAEGKRRLENGELPSAVLCFEAAVKHDPSNAEAWQLLGTTQAENEQDQLAINALNKCLELQPENLTAILCLAACYTNESCSLQACRMLMEWLNQNPKYSDIVKSKYTTEYLLTIKMNYMFTTKLYESVKNMYIEAAQRSLESGDIDVDVQNGLGVLLNLNNENDKAADCFKVALQIRPKDARLWNRLGATMANGGRCEEAIEAYHNALQLCPGFVRARYNLGITCIHLDTYREAIDHLLEALNQQASAVSTTCQSPALSDTIWSTLRLAISMAERPELFKAVNERNLDLLNEEFRNRGLYQSS
ncbi:peroxisomal targeting signal 1 receptor isoform X1 [Metopolophium dirhodum]|uniref:peroxisomal targeting signal 1 receptor isoform X1 n=1 Tax=Metopolophium dirhodum TaxID=44670 RepID=UPI00298F5294|nr:peroxisomal targeting signal 1 receptor isoform X1 [Metopolophium dirhodum]XP_060876873.1 peroxisomal targeting signal 1 receptor isoform X1 [Metopolophium dirhodum]XP_060876874.1 peroxisomal targeting signal 1 receptor isoform X1 [Metopolophium dirhodum]